MGDDDWDDDWDDDDFDPGRGAMVRDEVTDEHDDAETLSVTVTNPSGTVSVNVLIDGSPQWVDLAPRTAADMTESELAQEILLISRLARQNAQAGQHLLVSATLRRLGHDPESIHDKLDDLGLPSAEAALADKARVFANRYVSEDE